jgi:hypothetical protein
MDSYPQLWVFTLVEKAPIYGVHPAAGGPIFLQLLPDIQKTIRLRLALVEEAAGQFRSSVSRGSGINAPPYPAIKDGW